MSRFIRFFLPLRRLLLALGMALCAQPLLAQQYCTSVNDDTDYILGQAGGQASAMHWPTGLVWKRCAEGMAFSGSSCTGLEPTWNDWAGWGGSYLPRPFANQTNWGLPATSPDRVLSGDWRMGYASENVKITENCIANNPKVNRRIFPNTPTDVGWSASPAAGNVSQAWQVNFANGVPFVNNRNYYVMTRLVRGGQPFASLASPAALDAATGAQATFAPVTLAPSGGSGTAWGGARIAGGGSPQFQVNGGAWVQEAIVQSGDSLTVRLTAPASVGSGNTSTLTLHSGQTTGTSADGSNGGSEGTAVVQSTASFTVSGNHATFFHASPACGQYA